MEEMILRWLHIIGACTLVGTGAGIAFFMLMAHRTRNPAFIAHTASVVVIADWLFTASAILIQPLTGFRLAQVLGWPLTEPWLELSLFLYLMIGLCWLPVVWIQYQLRDLARQACRESNILPSRYFFLFRLWVGLGLVAFTAILGIIWLMVARPSL